MGQTNSSPEEEDEEEQENYDVTLTVAELLSSLILREVPDDTRTTWVNMPSGTRASVMLPLTSRCNCPSWLVGLKLQVIDLDGHKEQDLIRSEMQNTLGEHNISHYHIISVKKVVNCCLWRKFRRKESEIGTENNYVNQRMLFHGTSAADDIIRQGFDVSKASPGGMFGPGVYFAEHSSKSSQYTKTGFLSPRTILLCRVALGRMYSVTQAQRMTEPPAGYHSVRGVPTESGLKYPEYVVYDSDQVYPEYLISFWL